MLPTDHRLGRFGFCCSARGIRRESGCAAEGDPDVEGDVDHSPRRSTPVTDLNGHQIVGVKAHDVMAEKVPDKPLDRATHALLAQQLVAARTVAMHYPTVADATAAGYHLVGGGFGPGSGAHYIGGFFLDSIRAIHSR